MVKKRFYVIVKDFDKGVYTVFGPVKDDTPYCFRTVDLQRSSRNIS